ncbi:probable plastid-lipid-associated protein 12, chloroplastic [Capsicum annuum]|uniref:probable plastid-lipid-associated protein 12, chloroplastic n=1 Tax=Capsicum annuum TaxID=4072 RepID=UPI001FB0A92F|nr:probable plastid-lipid-associated protein 12, chloroplastic [Capsicum annuum]
MGTRVEEAIDEFISLNKNIANSELKLLEGEWQMIWSSQIVKPSGQLKFLVSILFGFRFCMTGKYESFSGNKQVVTIDAQKF